MYKIEKNIPIARQKGRPSDFTQALAKMDISDSLFVEKKITLISSLLRGYEKRNAPKKFVSRTIDNGVRIWRIK